MCDTHWVDQKLQKNKFFQCIKKNNNGRPELIQCKAWQMNPTNKGVYISTCTVRCISKGAVHFAFVREAPCTESFRDYTNRQGTYIPQNHHLSKKEKQCHAKMACCHVNVTSFILGCIPAPYVWGDMVGHTHLPFARWCEACINVNMTSCSATTNYWGLFRWGLLYMLGHAK